MYEKPNTPAADRQEQVNALVEELKTGVSDYLKSDRYKEILETFSKFHRYSLNNALLIMLQRPGAETVASYTTWKSLERQVNKGEKGIRILCPAPYKTKIETPVLNEAGQPVLSADGKTVMENKEITRTAFKVGYTFDISQTSGRELPEVARKLEGTVADYGRIKTAIEMISPVPVVYGSIQGEAKGYFSPSDHEIRVREGMSELQTIKTLLHECSHSRLHDPEKLKHEESTISRSDKEIQAESIAFVVAKSLGLDPSSYTIPYVGSWAGDEKAMMENLGAIKQESAKMIQEIREAMSQLEKESLTSAVYRTENGYLDIQKSETGSWDYKAYDRDFGLKRSGTVPDAGTINRAAEAAKMEQGIPGDLSLMKNPDDIRAMASAVRQIIPQQRITLHSGM